MHKGGKTSTKKKIRKLEKRVASLETTVAQLQLESGKQLLAVQDYAEALRYLHLPAHRQEEEKFRKAKYTREECERFFHSDWFTVLSDMDGPQMMEAVRKKAYNGRFNKLNYP